MSKEGSRSLLTQPSYAPFLLWHIRLRCPSVSQWIGCFRSVESPHVARARNGSVPDGSGLMAGSYAIRPRGFYGPKILSRSTVNRFKTQPNDFSSFINPKG